jgi:hypothetical protein
MSLYSRGSEMLNRSLLAIRVDCLLLQKKKKKRKEKDISYFDIQASK